LSTGKKIVLLGGSGFIGSALARHFKKDKENKVIGFDHTALDLTQENSTHALLETLNEEIILIFAARANPTADLLKTALQDVEMVTNFAQCIAAKKIQHLVYFSSTSVYSDALENLSITEETKPDPQTPYGSAKFFSECVLKPIASKKGTPMTILRPCMIYGSGDNSNTYGPTRFINSISKEKKVFLFGDGLERRNYLFIDDLVQIVDYFIQKEVTGTYNIAGPENHSFKEILDIFETIPNMKFDVVHLERKQSKVDLKLNIEKLCQLLPNFAFTPIQEGLAKFIL